jgi:hypothetical protein
MAGFTASSVEDILSEIRRIFERIPKEILTAVYNERIMRPEWGTEHKGEYIMQIQRNPLAFEVDEITAGHQLLDATISIMFFMIRPASYFRIHEVTSSTITRRRNSVIKRLEKQIYTTIYLLPST